MRAVPSTNTMLFVLFFVFLCVDQIYLAIYKRQQQDNTIRSQCPEFVMSWDCLVVEIIFTSWRSRQHWSTCCLNSWWLACVKSTFSCFLLSFVLFWFYFSLVHGHCSEWIKRQHNAVARVTKHVAVAGSDGIWWVSQNFHSMTSKIPLWSTP